MITGRKYRVHCLKPGCGWRGVRTDSVECECYEDWAAYCRPGTPGPGCPRGIVWPCPRCGRVERSMSFPEGSTVITAGPVKHRTATAPEGMAA